MPSTTIDALTALIAEELPDLVAIRHDLHAHPELGFEETRTSGVVRAELKRAGVAFEGGLAGGTGVLAHLPGTGDRAVALRADMDALPITEMTGRPYASTTPGTMHACGHDGHTTMLLGAARVLARLAADGALPNPVTFVFQPAEEGGGGGERMVADGCLDGSVIGPAVDRIFAAHGWPSLPAGTVGLRSGPAMAAADMFEITVTGHGAHAAWPHLGRDPIVAASAIVTALQTITSRNADPFDAIVVSTTQINGGTTHNVIPARVTLGGTVRTLAPETQALASERLSAIADGVARAHGCEAEVEYRIGYPVTSNDPGATAAVRRVATEAFGADRVAAIEHPSMGGEDFAYYGQRVPACFVMLGLRPDGGRVADLHHPTFDFNDDVIPAGVELFCRLALDGG